MSRQRKEQPAKGKVKTYTGAIIRLARYAMVASMHHAMLKPIPWQPVAVGFSVMVHRRGGSPSSSSLVFLKDEMMVMIAHSVVYRGLQMFCFWRWPMGGWGFLICQEEK